jgi:hypothetical protein
MIMMMLMLLLVKKSMMVREMVTRTVMLWHNLVMLVRVCFAFDATIYHDKKKESDDYDAQQTAEHDQNGILLERW